MKARHDAQARAHSGCCGGDGEGSADYVAGNVAESEVVVAGVSNPDQVAVSVLVNAALITVAKAANNGTQGPWVLTDDVRYSLLVDEESCRT